MKKSLFPIFSMLFILSLLHQPNTFAQDSSQFSLPEEATTRFGKGRINEIQYSPDGTRLAVASSIGIWLYDTTTYKEVNLFTGHKGNVNCIAFSPNGQTIATGSTDKTVRLWDVATGENKRTLKGHLYSIHSIAFSPDGQTLASGSTGERDGGQVFGAEIRIWDTVAGKHKHKMTAQGQVISLAFSPDGNILASGEDWPEHAIRLWEVSTGNLKHTLLGHTGWVGDVAFGPDGRTLVW